MKQAILFILILLAGNVTFSQSQYEISKDPYNGSKVLKGILTKKDLTTDTSFAWFAQNQINYTPNASAVEELKKNAGQVNLIAFSGTWCSDSKQIIPKLYALMDAANFPQEKLTLIGTDRSKKTLGHLAEAFNIINVPTIIVMKDGKEVGRVVEYGKYGLFDKELGEIIKNATTVN